MRISSNPLHNSYYRRYEKNHGFNFIVFAFMLWPVWVFPLLMVIGSFSK